MWFNCTDCSLSFDSLGQLLSQNLDLPTTCSPLPTLHSLDSAIGPTNCLHHISNFAQLPPSAPHLYTTVFHRRLLFSINKLSSTLHTKRCLPTFPRPESTVDTFPPVTVVSASTASTQVVVVSPVVSTTTEPTWTSTTLVSIDLQLYHFFLCRPPPRGPNRAANTLWMHSK